jgi:predicted AlkP superfamily phosphohydrolase/phosphomutase
VNEWLIEQGLLVLNRYPDKPTPMLELDVNWDRTVAWSEGGYYARVFLNVKGREPRGTIDPQDYERVRDELKSRFEATKDDRGKQMATRVFKPQEIYRQVRNLPPDLIVHFDDLYWRSVGKVGYRAIHVQENDTGPDDCNHAQFGAFILASPGCELRGRMDRVHLLDLTPTLLELGGYDPLPEMQGKSILARGANDRGGSREISQSEEEIIRQRLSGLGYV